MSMTLKRVPGSSPLTRGAHENTALLALAAGLIPAHAGSTDSGSIRTLVDWAHPRSRGEHTSARLLPLPPAGSSPLTRGALVADGIEGLVGGLIPAHAGSTMSRSSGIARRPAHPRSRGEHLLVGTQAYDLLGSSPLTRGALLMPRRIWRLMGLIPAHAGSTSH